ncbi:3'-5' exonuclease [Aliiglaciecola sp. CAU 1673]|uniref:3'-5' exonuclease n=1 Tax=Aliiglaciecola sp. CAU 1673 TaxID=3032595 RepID=UPI0023DA9D00|nr:3'-5' exonuclease [Aliiglaciecola sp. CAU 1673]MDF2180013.1 3'-5' exonuclease [Aliiglaciecola sp. CAU 1673]
MLDWLFKRWRDDSLDWRDYQYLAIDLELTGLEADKCDILSIAWVALKPPNIELASAREFIVNTQAPLGQSPTIHGLTQRELGQGSSLTKAVEALFEQTAAMRNCVWLFHHASLDMAFLQLACKKLDKPWAPPPVVDTLVLEGRSLRQAGREPKAEGLSLAQCRERYGLPAYPAHSAMEDALATAELFLSFAYQHHGQSGLRLSRLTYRPLI